MRLEACCHHDIATAGLQCSESRHEKVTAAGQHDKHCLSMQLVGKHVRTLVQFAIGQLNVAVDHSRTVRILPGCLCKYVYDMLHPCEMLFFLCIELL